MSSPPVGHRRGKGHQVVEKLSLVDGDDVVAVERREERRGKGRGREGWGWSRCCCCCCCCRRCCCRCCGCFPLDGTALLIPAALNRDTQVREAGHGDAALFCFGAFFFGSGHGGERRGVIRERQKTLPSSSSSLFSSSYPRHPGVRHNRRNAVSGVLGARDQGDTAPGGLFEEVAWAVRRRKVVVEVSFFYRSFFPFFPRRRRKSKVASGKKLTSCSAALRSSSVDFPENMGPVMISIRPTGGWSLPLSSSESFAPRQAEATIARCG